MKIKKQSSFLLFLLFSIGCHQPAERQYTDIYAKCMEKFQNEKSCREMVGLPEKQGEDMPSSNSENPAPNFLFIRNDLKDLLQGKSKSFVISKIGIPDEVMERGGYTYFKYKRSVTRYSSATAPDVDLTVIFKNSRVSQVNHTPPG